MLEYLVLIASGILLAQGPAFAGETRLLPAGMSLLAGGLLALLHALLGYIPVAVTLHRIHRDPPRVPEAMRGLARMTLFYRVVLLGFFYAHLHLYGWREAAVRIAGGEGPFLLPLLLAPLVAMWVLSWIPYALVDHALRGREWRFGRYLSVRARTLGMFLLPVLALQAFVDLVLGWSALPAEALGTRPGLLAVWGIVAGSFLFFHALSPYLLRCVWPCVPLPAGHHRDRIEALADRFGFDRRRILQWCTGEQLVNALTVGLIPRTRILLVSDGLLANLTPEESEAVLAHEIGHAREHHFLYYFMLVLLFLGGILILQDRVGGRLEASPVLAFAVFTGALAAWGGIFGFLSRRFERQADCFAAAALENPSRMRSALARIASLGFVSTRLRNFTHGSIRSRLRFLARVEEDPAEHLRLNRGIRATGLLLFLALSAVLAYFLWPS